MILNSLLVIAIMVMNTVNFSKVKSNNITHLGPPGRNGLVGEDGSSGRVGKLGPPGQKCMHASRSSSFSK